MRAIRTMYYPVNEVVEVKFYIHIQPMCDPHFHEPDYYYTENGKRKYFDTKEEAEAVKRILKKDRKDG